MNTVETAFGLRPQRLMGDTAYGTASMGYLVEEKHIAPHIPVWDKSHGKAGLYPRSAFIWHDKAQYYECPAGKQLVYGVRKRRDPSTGITKDNTVIYRAAIHNCQSCDHKPQCCPNVTYRKIARSIHESARDVARKITQSPEYEQSRKDRKKVEVVFGHMKNILHFDRLRLRGMKGAQDEFLLVVLAHNLRKLARSCYRPPPDKEVALSSG